MAVPSAPTTKVVDFVFFGGVFGGGGGGGGGAGAGAGVGAGVVVPTPVGSDVVG
jgi:hypothetical protein